jgi:hypothetical protein
MDSNDAFKVLKSELKSLLKQVQTTAAEEILRGNLEAGGKLVDRAKALQGLENTLGDLHREWKKISPQPKLPGVETGTPQHVNLAPNGTKTNEKYFKLPILQALEQNGGKGTAKEITDIVGEIMKDRLNDYDKEVLENGRTIRWRSTTAFMRLKLVKAGLMRSDSEKGTWEISQEGREYLENTK